jgi:hypothetical protein
MCRWLRATSVVQLGLGSPWLALSLRLWKNIS